MNEGTGERFSVLTPTATDDAVILLDPHGSIVSWNGAAERIKGYRSADMVGRHISMLYTPQEVTDGKPAQQLEIAAVSGQFEIEGWLRRKDGSRFWGSRVITALLNAQGGLHGYAVIIRDMSDSRRTQNELRTQSEILKIVFDHIPIMISFVGQDGIYRLLNREWERTLGWTLEEIQSQNIDIFAELYPDPQSYQEVKTFIAHADANWSDFKTRVRDGRIIHTTWTRVKLSDGSSIGIGRDVTDRKRAEMELESSREQLRVLAAYLQAVREQERTSIARELHDEIGQTLTAIKYSLGSSSGEFNPTGADLHKAQELINELIGRVHDLSLELRPAMLDDLGLLPALLWQINRYEDQFKVSVDFKYSGLEEHRYHPEIETASYRIIQEALTNFARHARTKEVSVSISQDEEAIHIHVQDNGVGFDAEAMLSHAPTTGGLAGMRERALMLGGHFEVESAPGAGSHLIVELPLRPAPIVAGRTKPATKPPA